MKKLHISLLALSVSTVISGGAIADSMSVEKYSFLKKNINTEYGVAIMRCNPLPDKASLECVKVATSNRDKSNTELQDSYKPAGKTKAKTSKVNTQKDCQARLNGDQTIKPIIEDSATEYRDSAVTEVHPPISINKNYFKNQNKPIAM